MEILLDAGADANLGDDYGFRPLHYAADMHHDLVAILLGKGNADPNVRLMSGVTPLMMAVRVSVPFLCVYFEKYVRCTIRVSKA